MNTLWRTSSLRWIVVLLLVITLMMTGCSQSAETDVQQQTPITYTIGDAKGDWGFPNPWGHYQRGPGYIRMSLIFDTLVWKDQEGLVPAIASEWSYDQEDQSYAFVVRNDIHWHDGKPLTAEDIVFTFSYMKEHPYPWGNLSSIEKVTAEEGTVKIQLKESDASFLTTVAATVPIIPKHIWESVAEPKKFKAAEAAIGCGPFKLVEYSQEQGTYLYKANGDYYGGTVRIDELRFVKVAPQMAATALLKGEVNCANIQPDMAEELEGKGLQVICESGATNVKLMYNHSKAPFAERELRQAVAYAIDRDELLAKAQRGYGLTGSAGMLSPESSWYYDKENTLQYHYNVDKTQELMRKHGYSLEEQEGQKVWTKDGKTLELEILCEADLIRAAEVLKEQLGKAGYRVVIKSVETKTRDAKITAWDFDLALNLHGGLGGDPDTLNKFILVDDFNSARYYENEELLQLLKEQETAIDKSDRAEIIAEIQYQYSLDIPTLTLYYPGSYWAHDSRTPLFYTNEGIAIGIPIPLNKLSFID